MKKIFLFSLFFITANALAAATPWWEQPTICRLNPATCYTAMGTGYDSGMWDANANCWGMKWICGDALTNTNQTTLVGRTEISRGTNIDPDYDLNVLDGDCFGVRKTSTDGAMASVDGKMVRVWCTGILADRYIAATIENGDVAAPTYQPSCEELARDGYVAISNGKCYGKYYDPARYYILCNGENPTLVLLNGANYDFGHYPTTQDEADTLFNQMYENVHGGGRYQFVF